MTKSQIENITVLKEQIEEVIETHISWLLLTHDFVYKMKKTISFSFLDFSSLVKRKQYCEEEVQLNRRLTEDMYLEVVPIVKKENGFFIGEKEGNIVDYAVKMKRIESSRQMHLLLEKNQVTKKDIEAVAKRLVAFHQKAKIITRPLNVLELKENFNDLNSIKDFVKKELGENHNRILQKAIEVSDQYIENNSSLLEQRIQKKMIRDGHGDLHSSNIFLAEKVIIFDCIEFNAKFREIDILNELAFFCIDLEIYNHEDFSQYFMEKYIEFFPEVLENPLEKKLFVYYKLYRANIRAKVNCLKARQLSKGPEKEKQHQAIVDYFHLMEKYLRTFPYVQIMPTP